MKAYTITTKDPTDGPWRLTVQGKHAEAQLADGRVVRVSVVRDRRVRIPYKPRGKNWGWTYVGYVWDGDGKRLLCESVGGSIGVRGLLKLAGLLLNLACPFCGKRVQHGHGLADVPEALPDPQSNRCPHCSRRICWGMPLGRPDLASWTKDEGGAR